MKLINFYLIIPIFSISIFFISCGGGGGGGKTDDTSSEEDSDQATTALKEKNIVFDVGGETLFAIASSGKKSKNEDDGSNGYLRDNVVKVTLVDLEGNEIGDATQDPETKKWIYDSDINRPYIIKAKIKNDKGGSIFVQAIQHESKIGDEVVVNDDSTKVLSRISQVAANNNRSLKDIEDILEEEINQRAIPLVKATKERTFLKEKEEKLEGSDQDKVAQMSTGIKELSALTGIFEEIESRSGDLEDGKITSDQDEIKVSDFESDGKFSPEKIAELTIKNKDKIREIIEESITKISNSGFNFDLDSETGDIKISIVNNINITININISLTSTDVEEIKETTAFPEIVFISLPEGGLSLEVDQTLNQVFSTKNAEKTPSYTVVAQDPSIISVIVDGFVINVIGLAEGSTVITVVDNTNFIALPKSFNVTVTNVIADPSVTLKSILISPENPVLSINSTLQLVVTGTYTDDTTKDLTNSSVWSSSDATVVQISDFGLITAIKAGSSTITVTSNDISGTLQVTVTGATLSSITFSPSSLTIAEGTASQLNATGIFSDNSTQDITEQVTWESLSAQISSVSNVSGSKGLVVGLSSGISQIKATLGDVSGTVELTVSDTILNSIALIAAVNTVTLSSTIQISATGTYSNSTTQDLTSTVTWSTSDSSIAEISNNLGTNGLVTGKSSGTATITATLNGISSQIILTVSDGGFLYWNLGNWDEKNWN